MNLYQIPIYICNYLSFYGMHTISFSSIFATLYNLYYMTRRMILVLPPCRITGQIRTSRQTLTFNFIQENIRYII
jgi:hypothetical protein